MSGQARREKKDWEGIDVAWAMVKDKEVREKHPRAYRWARAYLGLEDRDEVRGTRHPHDPEEDVNA